MPLAMCTASASSSNGISATTGFKPKFRFTCATANANNAISGFYITGVTDATSQQTQYPLDTATVAVSGMATGSILKASKVSDGTILFFGPESAGNASFQTDYIGAVKLTVKKASAAPFYKPWVSQVTTVSNATVSATALQVLD